MLDVLWNSPVGCPLSWVSHLIQLTRCCDSLSCFAPIVLPIAAPTVVTTINFLFWITILYHLVFSVARICVPNFVTTRHLVLDPTSVPNSVFPTFVTIHHLVLNPILSFVTVRHLVLNPILSPAVPIVAPISVPVILLTLLFNIID